MMNRKSTEENTLEKKQGHFFRQSLTPFRAVCILAAAAVAIAAFAVFGQGTGRKAGDLEKIPEEKKLVLFTSHKPDVYGPIVREFESRTGIWVDVRTGGTTELLENIEESRKKGDFSCDLMFGGGIESYEAAKENFECYRIQKKEEIISRYQSREDLWTPFTRLPIVFIYNNKLVGKEDAPHSWKELFTDSWRGRIAFADPARSGSSCTMLETMLQVLDGDEDQVLKDFAGALDGSLLESSGAVLEDVAAGRKMVGITLEETARKWIDRGADLTIVYPEEGTSALPDGCAVVKGARHRKNAELFLEFIVSDDTQRFAEEYLCRRTIREDLELETKEPEGKLIRFDLELAVERQKRILEKWAVLTDEGKN